MPKIDLASLAGMVQQYISRWKQLRKWDDGTWRKFRADYSVRELEMRFELEKEWLTAGKSIRCRNFYTELKERIMKKQDVPI